MKEPPIREPWDLPAITDADMAAAVAEGERYRVRLAELFERTDTVNDRARALSFQVARATHVAETKALLTEIQRLNYVYRGLLGLIRAELAMKGLVTYRRADPDCEDE